MTRRLHGSLPRTPAEMLDEAAAWCRSNDVQDFDAYGHGAPLQALEAKCPVLLLVDSGGAALAIYEYCTKGGLRGLSPDVEPFAEASELLERIDEHNKRLGGYALTFFQAGELDDDVYFQVHRLAFVWIVGHAHNARNACSTCKVSSAATQIDVGYERRIRYPLANLTSESH